MPVTARGEGDVFADLQEAAFLGPGPAGLLRIWQFAGPACCCKASTLARGAGPQVAAAVSPGTMPWETCKLPWQDWWPTLARSGLMNQLAAPNSEHMLSLDAAWVAIHARPSIVHETTTEGRPLIAFMRSGRRAIAELLRRHGAAVSRPVANEVLYASAKLGNAASVDLLLFDSQGLRCEPWASPNSMPVRHGGTPLDVATANGHTECAELLRLAGGRHSLHRAAALGLPDDVSAWLEDGGCVDERDGSGATPLCLAVRGPGWAVLQQLADVGQRPPGNGVAQCVRLLLDAQATVDALPITQETPLLSAADQGDVRLCSMLLDARADPLVRDRKGRTALDVAANVHVRAILSATLPGPAPAPLPAAWGPGHAAPSGRPGTCPTGASAAPALAHRITGAPLAFAGGAAVAPCRPMQSPAAPAAGCHGASHSAEAVSPSRRTRNSRRARLQR